MKTKKKIIFLSIIGCLGLVLPALAAEIGEHLSPKSINIHSDVPGDHSSTRRHETPAALPVLLNDREDHLAKVFNLAGDVRLLKKGTDAWLPAQKDVTIEAGDQILTGKQSFVDIAYDHYFLNIARIEQNTKAEFLSIEPTIVRLEDGAVFSALDGLMPGHKYEIMTPTAVAGVRGTHFGVSFDAETKTFSAATFPVNDNHESMIVINPVESAFDQGVQIPEGSQVDLLDGGSLSQNLITEIDQDWMLHAEEIFEGITSVVDNFETRRKEGLEEFKELLPRPDPEQLLNDDDQKLGGDKPPHDGPGDMSGNWDKYADSLLDDSNLLSTERSHELDRDNSGKYPDTLQNDFFSQERLESYYPQLEQAIQPYSPEPEINREVQEAIREQSTNEGSGSSNDDTEDHSGPG